jgi:hypothetical protein
MEFCKLISFASSEACSAASSAELSTGVSGAVTEIDDEES